MHPETLREHIRKCRAATPHPFGVNIPLMYPQIEEIMQIVAEEGVKVVFTSAGSPKKWTGWLHDRGITVLPEKRCLPCGHWELKECRSVRVLH